MTSLILATVVAFSPAVHQQAAELQWEVDYGQKPSKMHATQKDRLLVVIEDGHARESRHRRAVREPKP